MTRRGFTLLELLVAVGVFIVGFVAAYGLFLTAVRNRAQAEAITRTSLAATSLLAEMRLVAGREGAVLRIPNRAPDPPASYGGDGFAHNGQEDVTEGLVRYPDQAGIWYVVIGGMPPLPDPVDLSPSDLAGSDSNAQTVAIKLALLIMHCPIDGTVVNNRSRLSWQTLKDRFRLNSNKPEEAMQELRNRHLAQVYEAVIHRQASWLP